MTKPKSTPTKVLLQLDDELLPFVDQLRTEIALAGIKLSRQDAIRHTLAQLKKRMELNAAARAKGTRKPRRNR